jgi:two-component system LytT family response regulator
VASGRTTLDRLLVKEEGRMYFVPVAEIDWIEAFGNYARLHTGPRTHLIRETMATLERALDTRRFARIHRSTIVNLDRIRQMDLWGSGDYMVRLADGTQLKLSRWYRDRLEARMKP